MAVHFGQTGDDMEEMKRSRDWQPDQYLLFQDERTQPAIDLIRRVGPKTPARILDLGCGPGNSTGVLAAFWPDAELTGVDSSETMLEKAAKTQVNARWVRHDGSRDMAFLGRFDLIFSNAALQWIPGTEQLLPRLYAMLNPGGTLAVQAPYVRELPVYSRIVDLTERPEWKRYFAEPVVYPLHRSYRFYYAILATLGAPFSLFQTEYIHVMDSHEAVVEWYKEGSGLRPFLNKLPSDELRERFTVDYAEEIRAAYPVEADGKVLLPFNRVFFIVEKN